MCLCYRPASGPCLLSTCDVHGLLIDQLNALLKQCMHRLGIGVSLYTCIYFTRCISSATPGKKRWMEKGKFTGVLLCETRIQSGP
uniref:Uncharacterized protein n=1 Tax=Aegilops tauschii subsp. strangulata TaxID=200361 RepID=A0A453GX24_AEGTS